MRKLIAGASIIILLAGPVKALAGNIYEDCCRYGNPGCCWVVIQDWLWEHGL